jgi:hypothetical protein
MSSLRDLCFIPSHRQDLPSLRDWFRHEHEVQMTEVFYDPWISIGEEMAWMYRGDFDEQGPQYYL